jgi:methionine-S-sulfoxide reductase
MTEASRIRARAVLIAGGLVGAVVLSNVTFASEEPRLVPAALHDVAAGSGTQTAVFAGGCFWGTQGVFQHVEGVVSAAAGYAGGSADTATYKLVETGRTGHAEAVQVVFDPNKISYGQLMRIFFSVVHDPTQVDRQGLDIGRQYRSAIFPLNDEQATSAAEYIEQLNKAKVFKSNIATTVEPGKAFYKAEAYHQNFMAANPTQPYVVLTERPKVGNLQWLFPQFYREQAILLTDGQG